MGSWKSLMRYLRGTGGEVSTPETNIDIPKIEAQSALSALDHVDCVEVSAEAAEQLGAFSEPALSIDDVVDGNEE